MSEAFRKQLGDPQQVAARAVLVEAYSRTINYNNLAALNGTGAAVRWIALCMSIAVRAVHCAWLPWGRLRRPGKSAGPPVNA